MELINGIQVSDSDASSLSPVPYPVRIQTGNITMDAADLNKIHVFTAAAVIDLEEIVAEMFGKFLIIIKATTGSIAIQSGGSDNIIDKPNLVNVTAENYAAVFIVVTELGVWRLPWSYLGSWLSQD